ncbi:hypothetical protein TNCV_2325831 [Trichonephila clavipes]|nr:hypothetical protein TNCV_2325831 [Trichonephila clavipes]
MPVAREASQKAKINQKLSQIDYVHVRLTYLVTLAIGHGIHIDIDNCIKDFAMKRTRKTDHLIGTSAHTPQFPTVKYTEMGTVGLGPHGLLRHF